MSAPLRLVVFDMDGTLIDSQEGILACLAAVFERLGRPALPREAFLSIVGLSLYEAFARLMPGASHAELCRAEGLYREIFVVQRQAGGGEETAPLYPGARAALDRLAADDGLLMGVATGKARRGLDHAFAAHDLGRYFVTAQTADGHPSKPHPSMLLACLAETGVDATQAVMIGDTTYDIDMGRAAGFRTIGVGWGYHQPAALVAAGADLVLDRFEALDAALNELWMAAT